MRIGHNIAVAKDCRIKQMEYLMANLSEPVISRAEAKSGEFNKTGICLRILNTKLFKNRKHAQPGDTDTFTIDNVPWFMSTIQSYLPKEMRFDSDWASPLWQANGYKFDRVAEDTQECLDRFVDWLNILREKIQDMLALDYYEDNTANKLEILKRRYKNNWSDKVEYAVDADVDAKSDTSLNINISEV